MMSFNKTHKNWIRNDLVPGLIKNQKLFALKNPFEHVDLKSLEIEQMSHEVAFMLTYCYYIKIILELRTGDKNADAKEIDFHLVVKVNFIIG